MSRSCQRAMFSSDARAFVADEPREAGHLLAAHRVPLVRHGRGALLARAERLLHLAHLGLLQGADLGRELLEAGGDQREGGHHLGVPVALEDLRRDGRGQQAQPRADRLLDLRRQVREGAHGARELAVGDRGPRAVEPLELPLQLRVPQGHLQAEGHRLGVDAVRAADHRRVLVAQGPLAHRFHQVDEVRAHEVARVAHQDGERRVHHVRRGEPVVQPAPLGPHVLGHARDEGDDVVLDLLLDLLDARDVEAGPGLDRGQGLPRHHAALDEDLGGGDLHLEPGGEAVLVGPQAGHLGTRVARDHGPSLP